MAATLQYALSKNIPISHSGRTLAEILSPLCPEKLSLYTVDNIVPGYYGREETVVHYSHPESQISVGFFLMSCYYVTILISTYTTQAAKDILSSTPQ